MPAGLFGKLPAKRDFVAANAPRRFLEVWEPWLQASVATSRQMLGEAWSDAYNRAPIWRFWLGADFCGEATIGAFMPSIDGVGRSFPLDRFRRRRAKSRCRRRSSTPTIAWCEAAEAILLDALEPDATFEGDRATGRRRWPPPALQPRVCARSPACGNCRTAASWCATSATNCRRVSRGATLRPSPRLRVAVVLVDDRRRRLSAARASHARTSRRRCASPTC